LKGEKEAAYHIDFHLKDSRHWAVIRDMRVEWNKRVAQIDHLSIDPRDASVNELPILRGCGNSAPAVVILALSPATIVTLLTPGSSLAIK
jgi:hypothetical protein